MSSDGELYISENCSEEFKAELDKMFGKDAWLLDYSKYANWWGIEDFPKEITINVLNPESDEILGTAKIISEPMIEDTGFNRYIEMYPKQIKVTKNGN